MSPREKVTKILNEFDAKGDIVKTTNRILALYTDLLYEQQTKNNRDGINKPTTTNIQPD